MAPAQATLPYSQMTPSRRPKLQTREGGVRLGVVQPIAVEDDAALVAAFRGGDLGAAGRLYDRHVDAVYGLVFRLLGPEGEMDDLVQEVFTDALSSIHKLREPAALKGWLMSIAVGRVRSYIRWRRRKRWLTFLPTDELPEQAHTQDETTSEVVREVCTILQSPPCRRTHRSRRSSGGGYVSRRIGGSVRDFGLYVQEAPGTG